MFKVEIDNEKNRSVSIRADFATLSVPASVLHRLYLRRRGGADR